MWWKNPGEDMCLTVSPKNMDELLGPRRYKRDENAKKTRSVWVTAWLGRRWGTKCCPSKWPSWTGTGKMELTGSLGDVMKESIRTAVSCIRTHAKDWGVAPPISIPKRIFMYIALRRRTEDGPSAGIAHGDGDYVGTHRHSGAPRCGHDRGSDAARPGAAIGGLREKSMADLPVGGFTRFCSPPTMFPT